MTQDAFFSSNMATTSSGISFAHLLSLAPTRRIVMSRPARKTLFCLLLISGCGSPHQEALRVAKPPEPPRAPIAPKFAETSVNQGAPMATPASPTLSREEIRLLKRDSKRPAFTRLRSTASLGQRPGQECCVCKQRAQTLRTFWKLQIARSSKFRPDLKAPSLIAKGSG